MKKNKFLFMGVSIVLIFLILASFIVLKNNQPIIYNQNLNYNETIQYINNPDQGFYKTACIKIMPNSVEDKSYIIQDEFQLYHLRMDLSAFSSKSNLDNDIPLTPTSLQNLENLIVKFFEAEKNIIIRFSYDPNFDGLENKEPSKEIILQHISQICSVLNKYPLTITAIEAGMIGPWGEMHSSSMATPEIITEIIQAFLNHTNEIPILVRTPKMIYDYLGITLEDLPNYSINNNSIAKRIGLFNDGYLGSETDLGTYSNRELEIDWLSKNILNLPFGGEVTRPKSNLHDIDNCIPEMFKMNLSYLNYEWNDEITQDKWQNQKYTNNSGNDTLYFNKTAYHYINNHLGYRFVLTNSLFKYYKLSKKLEINLSIKNVGFGQLNRTKNMQILLVQNNNILHSYDIGNFYGQSSITSKIDISKLKGDFDVYLSINSKINDISHYHIQFSNDLWNSEFKSNLIGELHI
jgi:hypothetical protein